MSQNSPRAGFAERMNEVCDDLKIPRGHGRQAALARMLSVTPKGARKWLMGQGWPELDMAARIAELAKVNLTWLLQGHGPKRGTRVDPNAQLVVEALDRMPLEERRRVLGYLRYELAQNPSWFVEQEHARYIAAIDAFTDEAEQPPPFQLSRTEAIETGADIH